MMKSLTALELREILKDLPDETNVFLEGRDGSPISEMESKRPEKETSSAHPLMETFSKDFRLPLPVSQDGFFERTLTRDEIRSEMKVQVYRNGAYSYVLLSFSGSSYKVDTVERYSRFRSLSEARKEFSRIKKTLVPKDVFDFQWYGFWNRWDNRG